MPFIQASAITRLSRSFKSITQVIYMNRQTNRFLGQSIQEYRVRKQRLQDKPPSHPHSIFLFKNRLSTLYQLE